MKITKHEARVLIFWASVGFRHSVGGSYLDVPQVAEKIARRFDIPFTKKDFQKGNKMSFWFSPKVASELWKSAVGQPAKIPFYVKSELYKAVRFMKRINPKEL